MSSRDNTAAAKRCVELAAARVAAEYAARQTTASLAAGHLQPLASGVAREHLARLIAACAAKSDRSTTTPAS
jgi:hypothetical protein